ncbi:Crocetin glucosyltransferase, chloroplastic [Ananas comosus]|uniref:Glycosyltransferase n=1 Tax=Ananas comosus TaxID=4615 RepID=A0A199V5I4_ANACO|nr:Crocetin glucosyltransferase, chloroplastic [Ananas comosus]
MAAHLEQQQSSRQKQKHKHFLVATFPFQGHINPALNLAKRLALAAAPSASVTFSTTTAAHRRMFPSASSRSDDDDNILHDDGLLTYAPFSDGHDHGWNGNFAARGRPVSCIIYTIILPWVADVARRHGIPSTLYWIQPASVFAVYYHYFHGYDGVISAHHRDPSSVVNLPGLPPHDMRDLPSFLVDSIEETSAFYSVYRALRDLFAVLDKEKEIGGARPTVLVNTFEELEPRELASINEHLDAVPIGPVLKPSLFSDNVDVEAEAGGDLFERDDEQRYVEWLDARPEGSVVYVSFGSLSTATKAQLEELLQGLEGCGRPYIWVVRRDNRGEGPAGLQERAEKGVVVGWCDQLKVLSHRAVGCFVTHCGWNSVLESLACGVPMVAAPRMSDQGMNARLAAAAWGTAVRARLSAEGVLERDELRRCLETVLGEGDGAAEMRRRAETWREKAMQALSKGGSSDRNLTAYVESIIHLPNTLINN